LSTAKLGGNSDSCAITGTGKNNGREERKNQHPSQERALDNSWGSGSTNTSTVGGTGGQIGEKLGGGGEAGESKRKKKADKKGIVAKTTAGSDLDQWGEALK